MAIQLLSINVNTDKFVCQERSDVKKATVLSTFGIINILHDIIFRREKTVLDELIR